MPFRYKCPTIDGGCGSYNVAMKPNLAGEEENRLICTDCGKVSEHCADSVFVYMVDATEVSWEEEV